VKTHNWTGRFAVFVREYGVRNLANELGVALSSVYHWIEGSWRPEYSKGERIVEIAKGAKFELSIEDVMNHHKTIARGDR
jgi:hypothetical protein